MLVPPGARDHGDDEQHLQRLALRGRLARVIGVTGALGPCGLKCHCCKAFESYKLARAWRPPLADVSWQMSVQMSAASTRACRRFSRPISMMANPSSPMILCRDAMRSKPLTLPSVSADPDTFGLCNTTSTAFAGSMRPQRSYTSRPLGRPDQRPTTP